MNKEWSEKNKKMQSLIGKKESFEDGIAVLLERYDWTGKKVYAFATSGGSGIGKTAEKLQPYVNGAAEVDAKLVSSAADLKGWK